MLNKGKNRVISFDNSTIENLNPTPEEFGNSNKITYSFLNSKNEGSDNLKDLKLKIMKDTLSKYFILIGTFNKKQFETNLGLFKTKFKCKEIRIKMDKLTEVIRDKKLKWLVDPKVYLEEDRETATLVNTYETPTIRQAIEEICEETFPILKVEGSLSKRHMQDMFRYLCGYNIRGRFIKFTEVDGDGVMTFRNKPIINKLRGPDKSKPISSWKKLFKDFPSGKGVLTKSKHYNLTGSVSLYDDPISANIVSIVDKAFMKSYIQKYSAFGTKKNCLTALKYLWSYCSEKDWLGNTGVNPGQFVIVKRPKTLINWSTPYNTHKFSIGELERIKRACIELKDKFPFSVEVILFMMFTGRRFQEVIKIKRQFILKDQSIIQIPKEISKIREDQFVSITEPVKLVLDQLEDQRNKKGHEIFKNICWVFPTTRALHSANISSDYLNSYDTRMKTITNAWNEVKELADIKKGALKSFRKTYASIATRQFDGDTTRASKLTGHTRKETLERFYYQEHQEEVIESANKVAEVLKFRRFN